MLRSAHVLRRNSASKMEALANDFCPRGAAMVITLQGGADLIKVRQALIAKGMWIRPLQAAKQTLFLVEPHSAGVSLEALRSIEGVAEVFAASSQHPLVDAHAKVVRIGDEELGLGCPPTFMAGPCSVESAAQIDRLAQKLAGFGVRFLRGGAYKPRTSPYSFQGHGAKALSWLRAAADRHGLKVVTEATAVEEVALVAAHSDLIQVGSRNMSNFALLRSVAQTAMPVLLKRGMAATVEEWLSAAEYCLLHGARAVIFCERGIRGFDSNTRSLLDLGAVALLANVYHLPVLVDPSHAAGRRDLIAPLAQAALAAGACGLLIETHDDPGQAQSDGPQAVAPEQVEALILASRISSR